MVRKAFRLIFHPVAMIVMVQLTWTVALIFWIIFFVGRYRQMVELALRTGLSAQDVASWAPLVIGIVLLVVIFIGTLVLIMYFTRQTQAYRQMRNLLSFVSHELRTPLASIRLLLETVRDNPMDEKQRREFIDNTLGDVDRLSFQISSLLSAARIEQQRLPIRKNLFSLKEFVTDYVKQFKSSVEYNGHVLQTNDLDQVHIRGDREALTTALDNLVRNARQYSPVGTAITISLKRRDGDAALSIKDEGSGLQRREFRKIFRMFYRAKSAASRRGSGLGLYIVKGIVDQHKGKVKVESDGPGQGSTFTILLPAADQQGEVAK